MIEAVGAEFQQIYFETCDRLLKPGGKALIQAITISESIYDQYLNDTDFIRRIRDVRVKSLCSMVCVCVGTWLTFWRGCCVIPSREESPVLLRAGPKLDISTEKMDFIFCPRSKAFRFPFC